MPEQGGENLDPTYVHAFSWLVLVAPSEIYAQLLVPTPPKVLVLWFGNLGINTNFVVHPFSGWMSKS